MMPAMNPALKDFWATQSRNKVLYGGRASSKSTDAAINAIRIARKYSVKFLCTRQFQTSISKSVYTLLKEQINRFGFASEFEITNNTIIHKQTGSSFIFIGLARNIEEIKSIEGVDICWIEEAGLLTKEQWDILEPSIRKEHSEIWVIFNPGNRTDFVWQHFIEHKQPNTLVKKINYDENPFLSETMRNIIEAAKKDDYDRYLHVYEGKIKESDEKALFAFDEIENAMKQTGNEDQSGVFTYALDVARYGDDNSVLSKRKGFLIYALETYEKYNTMELANKLSHIEKAEYGTKPHAKFIDPIGVGAGVVDRLREKGMRGVIEANGSFKAARNDLYENKRAEMYFELKEFVRRGGKIPDDPELQEELLSLRYEYSKTSGRIKIQAKEEIKELIGRSPDKADSVAMHFFCPVHIENREFEQEMPEMVAGF